MRNDLRKVVVGLDSSKHALAAAEWGARVASDSGAELTLIHVVEIRFLQGPLFVDISGLTGAGPYEHVYENFHTALHARARNILAAGEAICEQSGVQPQTKVVEGVFADAIEEETEDANLLVLGRRGDNADFGLHLMGTDGERAIRRVDCSCLVVPDRYVVPKTVVVGVDDSGPARSACAWAEYLHEVHPELTMTPLHVIKPDEHRDEMPETVGGVPVQRIEGEPERVLAEACGPGGVETLCVIGATGHTRTLRELILGTLPFHLLHKVDGPVLLAR